MGLLSAKNSLRVCRGQEEVGRLWLDAHDQFTFQYSETWLTKDYAMPVSLSQPLQSTPIGSDRLRAFFTNLLPEDEVKATVARNLNLSSDSDFELLSAIAGDCIGNLSLFSQENMPASKDQYRPISESELEQRIAALDDQPLLAGEQDVRLSMSGNQKKLPVYINNNSVFIPVQGAPSSHIIKPAIKGLANTAENEAFCTELAGILGLNVIRGILKKGVTSYYLVERPDRRRTNDGQVHRIHQEDFCQVLNLDPHQKYEKEGGLSLKQCFNLIRQYSINPIIDTNMLLKWVLFNYLIGNHDAHAKNLAFLMTSEGPRLAPFCDLISTSIYQGTGQPLAMRIGGEDRPSWIINRRWEYFAKDVKIKPKYVKSLLASTARQIVDSAERLAKEYQQGAGDSVVMSVLQVIKARSRSALSNLRTPGH